MGTKVAASLAAISAGVLVGRAACASMSSRVQNKENLLAAAGFDISPATTPQREAEFKSLPPNMFVTRSKDAPVKYFYADPLMCNCLYTGDQRAFDNYRHAVFERHIADEQQLRAQMYQEPPGWWDGWIQAYAWPGSTW